MSNWSPPSPSRGIVAALVICWLLLLAYALLALQNVLAGLLPGLLVVVGYYGWRLLVAVEAVADGLQRLADTEMHRQTESTEPAGSER